MDAVVTSAKRSDPREDGAVGKKKRWRTERSQRAAKKKRTNKRERRVTADKAAMEKKAPTRPSSRWLP